MSRQIHPALIVIRSYQSEMEAEVAKTALDAAGIPSTVWSDTSGYGSALVFTRGVRLLVASDDVTRANEILRQK